MRIGIDATCWSNRRGFGRFARELLTALAALDSGEEYVLLADRQTAETADFPAGWKVWVGETTVAPSQAAAADGRRSLADLWAMRQVAMSRPLDLLFFPAVYSYFPVGGRTPCLVTFHDVIAETLPKLIFNSRRSKFFWDVKCKLAARRASRVLTVSQASSEGITRHFGIEPDRIRVISEAHSPVFGNLNGRAASTAAVLRRYGIESDERFVLTVGGISPHKNLDAVIRAMGLLADRHGVTDVRAVLVGDYKGDVFRTCHAELVRLAEQLGLSGRILFPGYVPDEDLAHLYAACAAFIFPSYLEGFGLPAVEAMACGAAVVASNRGSLPEVVGDAGLFFDPHQPAELAERLALLLNDRQLRSNLQTASRARAGRFSWERSARQLLEIFREFKTGSAP